MSRTLTLFALLLSSATGVVAQTPQEAPAPALRRWIDVQNVHLATRFRWVESNTDVVTSSTHQWQANVRARVLIDAKARYAVHVGAFTGNHFVSSWNNTGGGIGRAMGDFNVKQLFIAAEPVPGLEFQAGGLYVLRGEHTEITTYDNDAYIVGERVSVRRSAGPLAQLAATIGHIGDYRTPNVFRRFDAMGDVNYGQLLVGTRLGQRVNVSADYTYEDGRDIIREGATIQVLDTALPLQSIKVEAYQRVDDITGQGFNVSGDVRVTSAFTVLAGVTHIDRDYLIPDYMSPNGDRYERGPRFYTQGTYALTPNLSIGWFQGEAFSVDYEIPNDHRWEVLVTLNPTATLKRRGVF